MRQLPPVADLPRLFFHCLDRLVRRNSRFLAVRTVEVRFDPVEAGAVEVCCEG